jgi:PEGA domain-containing protein
MKAICLLMIVALSGCATVIRGTSEDLQIYSTPAGAAASLSDGQTCTTPCSVKIARGKAYQVTLAKDGCEAQTQLISPQIAGSGVAEAVVFGVAGGAVDVADDAVYDSQPNPLSATMNCKLAAADVKAVSATASVPSGNAPPATAVEKSPASY